VYIHSFIHTAVGGFVGGVATVVVAIADPSRGHAHAVGAGELAGRTGARRPGATHARPLVLALLAVAPPVADQRLRQAERPVQAAVRRTVERARRTSDRL